MALSLLLVLAAALAFRLPGLGARPFHGDEANQAVKAGILLETGRYVYDPHEHHGPTLYYGVLPLLWVAGVEAIDQADERLFRLLPVVFGAGVALLVFGLPGLGLLDALIAALFIALSNAMVFYSRYCIQEMMLVFFAQAALLCMARWRLRPGWGWALLAGLSLGLAHATKETSVLLGAGMVAAYAAALWLRPVPAAAVPSARQYARGTVVAAAAALIVSVVLFSAFFTHARGPLDSWLTYATYLNRAEGHGSAALHDKPWHYYFALLLHTHRMEGPRWSEAFALGCAVLGLLRALCFPASFRAPGGAFMACLIAVYALLVTAVYTLIPYKTPWNLLPFWQPLLVLAGIGAAWPLAWGAGWRPSVRMGWRIGCVVLIALGLAHAARQSYQGSFVYAADVRNPYVYAHTSTAMLRLTRRIDELSAVSPQGRELHINILKPDGDYWPLPWYLRGYGRVGYWTQPPERVDADVIIADSRLGDYVQERLEGEYQFEFHALRPEVKLLVFIRKPLWEAFMETRR
ncbi:MAG: hypothetical protein RLZZ303_1644 [Candidatus Hydrogenedentota bacterium]